MPPLLSCFGLAKSFGSRTVFADISLTIHEGDRLGLIGPNGAGKSTFLQILTGQLTADRGEVSLRNGARLSFVEQSPDFGTALTVGDVVRAAVAPERIDEHEKETRAILAWGRVGFTDPDQAIATLSGGWRKRLAFARELVKQPDLLILDEPTNHLDLDGIQWLEKLLDSAPFASLVVSHDRYFLDNVVTRMAEIDRVYPNGLFYIDGTYTDFLEKKRDFLDNQAKLQDSLANLVRREQEWLARRPKARTTKSKARIDAAQRLQEQLADLQERRAKAKAQIDFAATDRKTKRLVTLDNVSITLGGRTLFQDLKAVLSPGVRLGLVGANGTGKSTLLKLITGELTPTAGVIETADRLRIVKFDQYRQQIDPTVTLRRAMAPDGDSVIYNDRVIHVNSWAKRFLFRTEQLEVAVGSLSGGEQARLLIAKLMLQPADILLLDEPTNDLDIPTLEVLEESLMEFPGALVLVTHDRFLLDRVSTVVLALDGQGGAEAFADYTQYEFYQSQQAKQAKATKAAAKPAADAAPPAAEPPKKKLSYLEARELAAMEERILEAEAAVQQAQADADAAAQSGDGPRIQAAYAALESAQQAVEQLYARWADLEARAG